jgi:hypothetical protein
LSLFPSSRHKHSAQTLTTTCLVSHRILSWLRRNDPFQKRPTSNASQPTQACFPIRLSAPLPPKPCPILPDILLQPGHDPCPPSRSTHAASPSASPPLSASPHLSPRQPPFTPKPQSYFHQPASTPTLLYPYHTLKAYPFLFCSLSSFQSIILFSPLSNHSLGFTY